jgi:RHS repeat-associated protein
VFDDDNRLLQSEPTAYLYDNNGNLISKVGPEGATTYTWDARNRLAFISTATGQAVNFFYDFDDNLIQQRLESAGVVLTWNFILDELTNVVHTSSSGGDQSSVLTGQTIDQHLAVVHPSGQVEFGLSDPINSIVATTSQSGTIDSRLFYEPFGQTTSNGSGYPFQYTGRMAVSGNLYYYRARYYDSAIGRFTSEDLIELKSPDYVYVGNNPLVFTDPLGLQSIGGIRGLGGIPLPPPFPRPQDLKAGTLQPPKGSMPCLEPFDPCDEICKSCFSPGNRLRDRIKCLILCFGCFLESNIGDIEGFRRR